MRLRNDTALSPAQARRVYNRIGRVQDWQRLYEAEPIRVLIESGAFGSADAVYELGCGTGAFARRLLTDHLDSSTTYFAVDISDTMVRLSTERLTPWADRCVVRRVDGTLPLPGHDRQFDRFVANYVFDLLDDDYTTELLSEAERLLMPGGMLCAVSLTQGSTPVSRAVCRGWDRIWSRAPKLVGGCRPIALEPFLGDRWDIVHHRVVTTWGVPSQVIIATPACAG